MLLIALLAGCSSAPSHVEDAAEVDRYLSQKDFTAACVGLKNEQDPGLRTYTAQQLVTHTLQSVPRRCLCAGLYDASTHKADKAVAAGVQNSKRDDLARCLAPALSDALVEDRAQVAFDLGRIGSSAGYEALEDVLKGQESDPGVRAAVALALKPSSRARTTLIETVTTDPEPAVRAAAAEALEGKTQSEVVAAIGKVLDEDDDNRVRAVALRSLMVAKAPGAMRKVCNTLMKDDDATMRVGAAKALHGTKRAAGIDCLKKRLTTKEDNPAVRTAAMDALGASPSDKAADALCSLINPMLRLYVRDGIAEEMEGVDIIKHQNDRDWERSYDCVMKARAKGGLSCYARNHLGLWINDLGGKAARPWCPGMERR